MIPAPAAAARSTRSAAGPPGRRPRAEVLRVPPANGCLPREARGRQKGRGCTWRDAVPPGSAVEGKRSPAAAGRALRPVQTGSCRDARAVFCRKCSRVRRRGQDVRRSRSRRSAAAGKGKAWQAAAASRPSDASVLNVRGIRPRACGSVPTRSVRCGGGAWPRPSRARRNCGAARTLPGAPCVRSGGSAWPVRAAGGKSGSVPRARPVRCGAGALASIPAHTGTSDNAFSLPGR